MERILQLVTDNCGVIYLCNGEGFVLASAAAPEDDDASAITRWAAEHMRAYLEGGRAPARGERLDIAA